MDKKFIESIKFFSDKELKDKLSLYLNLQDYVDREAKRVEEIKQSDKKKATETSEYKYSVERKNTADVKEQYLQIYKYIKNQLNRPWYKYFNRNKSETPLKSLYTKLR